MTPRAQWFMWQKGCSVKLLVEPTCFLNTLFKTEHHYIYF